MQKRNINAINSDRADMIALSRASSLNTFDIIQLGITCVGDYVSGISLRLNFVAEVPIQVSKKFVYFREFCAYEARNFSVISNKE